jgi:hypothetical protein
MSGIEPLPPEWISAVLRILRNGQAAHIRWSFRAQQDWQQFGLTHQAFQHLIETLRQADVWGERISGMAPLPGLPAGAGQQLVYAFLCPHPLGAAKPLYAKIGLFDDHLTIDLFSLHVDLSGELEKRIARARKKRI